MASKPLYMETTEIAAERTAQEIVGFLVGAGANQINTEYESGQIKGLRWIMRTPHGDTLFAMPARVDPIHKILKRRQHKTWLSDQEKAKLLAKAQRVAWRQLLRWVQAQCAMIECGMAEAQEVFFPYIQTAEGVSVYEVFKDRGLKALPAPEVA